MNQFGLTPIKGSNGANFAPDTIACQVLSTTTQAYLVAGAAVALSSATGNTILVDIGSQSAANFGFIYAAQRKDKFYPGDALEVAMGGSILFLESGGVINRGNEVEFYPTGNTVVAHSTGTSCGIALDNAAATGALIRVKVQISL